MSEYLDALVVVKWFKKGEPYESEAMELYGKIRDLETDAVTSEWTALEVVRGLTKVGYPEGENRGVLCGYHGTLWHGGNSTDPGFGDDSHGKEF